MSSHPNAAKQKKKIRGLLETLSISQPRSPLPQSHEPDPSMSAAITRSDESTGTVVEASHLERNVASTYPISSVSCRSHGQEPTLQVGTMTTNSESIFAPIDSPSEFANSPCGTSTIAEHNNMDIGPDRPEFVSSTQARKSQNLAWDGLRESLMHIQEKSSTFPALSLALKSLLPCIDQLEMALQNCQDFEDLATDLKVITQSLQKHIRESSSIFLSKSTARIALAIGKRSKDIEKKLDHTFDGGGIREANTSQEELIGHYRQIQSHFERLQMDADMSRWCITNERLANARLEGLSPANQAAYDSGLSAQINRRGCTEGTRTGVLDGLDSWIGDLASSPIYWMNGMAGTGKTTIAATLCERLEQRKLLAGSFFCTRNLSECRDVTRIIPTIAYQLARYSIPFQSALCQVLEENSEIGSKNALKQFEKLLKEPLQRAKNAIPDILVVVIDALDECEDRNGIELVLEVLFRYGDDLPLKFLVTSRPEPQIYGKMSAYAQPKQIIHLHDIERSLVQADIRLYLSEELGSVFPARDEIEQLTQHSGTLFIYAATLVRYITGKRAVDPYKRLRAVLDTTPGSFKKHAQIDSLYEMVLNTALSEELTTNQADDILAVLRVVLLAQEPISVEAIAKLADIGDPDRVVLAVQPLRSVLHQSPNNGPVTTLHASFPDYMFSKGRSGFYFCDAAKQNQLLAQRCFLVMEEQLRFNICGLEASYFPDNKDHSIGERIKANISPVLAYACRYWPSHLASAADFDLLLTMMGDFLQDRLLFWMEVLNLRRELTMGVDGLLKAQQWLMRSGCALSEIMTFVDDARSFVTSFAVNPVSQSTPHIYISSLPFCPKSSSVHKHYFKRTQGLLELRGSLMERREAAPLATWIPGSEILALALSPDGTRVVIGCLDKTVSILSAYDGTVHVGPLQGHANSISSVIFSPDGKLIASASLGTFRVWNALNGTLIAGPFVGHMRHVNSVSFSPDSTLVVTGGHDCTIRVWDICKRTLVLGPLTGDDDREGFVLCVAFSPDGDLIASGSADRTVRLWKSQDGTPAALPFKGHTGRVERLVFTPDGTRLVTASNDNTIIVWNTSDGSIFNNKFEDSIGGINSLAVSRDGTRIAGGSSDFAVRVWKIDDGTLVAGPFFHHTESIKSVAYSPDGTRVFSGSSDKKIHVWNVRDGNFPPPPLPPQNTTVAIRSITFCPDSTHVLSSDTHSVIRAWDIFDGSCITLPTEGNFFPTTLTMLSPDGSCIAGTSKDGKIQIMSTSNGSLVAGPFEVEQASLSALLFSHNEKAIIMGCQDGTIKVCGLRGGMVAVGSFKGHSRRISSLTEAPNCSTLVSYSDYEGVIRIWNIVTPTLDLELFNAATNSTSEYSYPAVYDGWSIREDGWVVNSSQYLLFWIPPDVASAWCSPYATLILTKFGTLQVPKQRPLVGNRWVNCYIPN